MVVDPRGRLSDDDQFDRDEATLTSLTPMSSSPLRLAMSKADRAEATVAAVGAITARILNDLINVARRDADVLGCHAWTF
jgi:hypothetical protein